MKVIRITFRVLMVLIVIGIIGFAFLLRHISHRAIPDYNGNVVIESMQGRAEVLRDTFGIPHIYAENAEDLYRVTGYLMAQDRLWQMDLLRRFATGRLSEIFGERAVETDRLYRALRIEDKSKLIMRRTEPEINACVKAFAEGVNCYLRENEKNLPFEFTILGYKPEPWLPIHTYNMIGYFSWSSSSAWRSEPALYKMSRIVNEELARELVPDIKNHQAIFPDLEIEGDLHPAMDLLSATSLGRDLGLEVFTASNSWAVSGDRSYNGSPILCNDMHLQLDVAPGVWYQMHQIIPGEMNVSGMVLPGTPFVNVGHNDSIAWGMTFVHVDDIDFYFETLNPADTNQYLLNGEWVDMQLREETIRIKGGDSVTVTNRFTHRGPLINEFRGIHDRVVSMRWTGSEYSNEVKTAYLMNRSDNIYDFRESLRTWTTISCNSLVADASGNIALYVAAAVPLRIGNRALIMPGDTSLYDWIGFIPFEQLPHGINPPDGFLASANNRSAGPEYPYHISHWFGRPDRYNRILEMIREDDVFTIEDMAVMQSDQNSYWARKVMKVCGPVLDRADLVGRPLAAYDRIHAWDGTMDMDGVQSTLFEVFNLMLREHVFKDELGEDYPEKFSGVGRSADNVMDRLMEGDTLLWCDDINTPEVTESIQDLVVPAWNAAVEWLEKNYGKNMANWVWGDLHTLSLEHPLSANRALDRIYRLRKGPYRVGGAVHTICPYGHSGFKSFNVSSGSTQRQICNLLDPDGSLIITPCGVSGIPASDFYCNQTDLYLQNRYISESFSREKVERNTVYRSIFSGKAF